MNNPDTRQRLGEIAAEVAALRGLDARDMRDFGNALRASIGRLRGLENDILAQNNAPRPRSAEPSTAPQLVWVGKETVGYGATTASGGYLIVTPGKQRPERYDTRVKTFVVLAVERARLEQNFGARLGYWLDGLKWPLRERNYGFLERADEFGRALGEAATLAAAQAMAEADYRAQASR